MKLNNKNGTLTTYGFACGYIETKKTTSGYAQLFMDGCWHVQHFTDNGQRLLWECPRLLTEARKLFRSIK